MTIVAAHAQTPLRADWRCRYEVLARIGSGGTAEVFEAWDREYRRPVALKVVDERRGLTARVLREVQASAALNYPGIVRLYDWFTDGRRSYIVSELVEGRSLAAAADDLDDAAAVEIVAQVLEAVAHAHGQGVVHRDIKPQNVMVRADGRAMVMDFGIARLADTDTLTGEGDMLGTVAYMSPEQAAGHRVGPATDVYSAAVVLFELLAGVSPVRGDTPAETISTIVSGRAASLAAARPDLPTRVVDAVRAAMALAPSQRPTAAQLAAELRDILGEELLSRRRWAATPSRAQMAAERFGGAMLGGVAAAVLLARLPAYPPAWSLPLAATVAAVWALLPAAGLALLLGSLVFPLFNVSWSLGCLYVMAALGVLVATRARPICAVWPVAALVLEPIYLILVAPPAAVVLGRWRGPLTAAWSAAIAALYLILVGDGGPFAGFREGGQPLAASLAAAEHPLSALADLGAVILDPAVLAQVVAWAGMVVLARVAAGRVRLEQRLWSWAILFAAVLASTALVPAALGRRVELATLFASVAVAATVVVLPLLRCGGAISARRHRALAVGQGVRSLASRRR
jgi:hypothetical protein